MSHRRHRLAALFLATALPPLAWAAPAAKPPLENLDDNRLLDELAGRGLNPLLDYYFTKNHVPVDRQQEVRVVGALRNLDSDAFARKSEADQAQEIAAVVDGINKLLPTIQDPDRLMRYAGELLMNGTERPTNMLEMWGDNPRTQATLNPIAEAIDKILAQAQTLADKRAADILAGIKESNDPRIKQWEKANDASRIVLWTRALATYRLAISYDRASPRRVEVAKAAIEQLKNFEGIDADLAIAKLSMAMGGDDAYKQADTYFDKVIATQSDDPKNPKKFIFQNYQGRYFKLVNALLQKKPADAQKGLADLATWEEANLPTDQTTRLSMQSARSMLEYRVDATLAAQAKEPTEKQQHQQQAVGVLMELLAKRPDLRALIFEQVLAQLPDDVDVTKLDPLVLGAIMNRGATLARAGVMKRGAATAPKTATAAPDVNREATYIQLAADAAREIVRRKDSPGFSPAQVDSAAFTVGVLEEEIGAAPATRLSADAQAQNRKDAVEAYLTYFEKFGADKVRAGNAMDHALTLADALYRASPNDDAVGALYDGALDVAIHKAGRARVNYYLGQRLQRKADFAAAAKAFALVPADDPILKIEARYFQMFCDGQLLPKAEPAQARPLATEVQKLAGELSTAIDAQAPKLTPPHKAALESYKTKSLLIAAEAARANKDFATEVKLLDAFDAQAASLGGGERDRLGGNALFLRVNALIALDRGPDAVAAVQALMQRDPKKAFATVSELVNKISTSYVAERNKDHPDEAALTVLARQRAQLAAELVQQVQKNHDLPEKNRREYLDVNARAQVEAAKLEKDPAVRLKYLAEAMRTYQELMKGLSENDSEYAGFQRQTALAEFEIGDVPNLQKAHDTLQGLFDEKKFGTPMTRVGDESKSNDAYWEGLLYLLRCKQKLAVANNNPKLREEAVYRLKNAVIQFGDQTGGDAYAKDFHVLRSELLGDWKPEAISAPAKTQATR